MKSIIHDFTERLAFSQAFSDQESAWVTMYEEAWPTLLSQVRIDANSKFQHWGIDRHIYLPNGKLIAIDEKIRDPEHAVDRDGDPYADVLLEEWSVYLGEQHRGNKIGWALDTTKRCDYIAYALPLLHHCYLLPFELLRMAVHRHLPEWKKARDNKGRRCYPLDAKNDGYVTRNCAVSWTDLQVALAEQMKRVRCKSLDLPVPTIRGQQASFDWVEKDGQ